MEMPVTFESFARDSTHGLDRPKFGRARSPEMDRIHPHGSIIYHAPVEHSQAAFRSTGANQCVLHVGRCSKRSVSWSAMSPQDVVLEVPDSAGHLTWPFCHC